MRELTKAQFTVGFLIWFAMGWAWVRQALDAMDDPMLAIGTLLLQFVAVFILSIIILTILEWVSIFDLKTNAVVTLITILSFAFVIM